MALPTSRNRTYAIGDPIVSADLNDFQDQISALHNGRRGLRRRIVPPTTGRFESGQGLIVGGNGWIETPSGANLFFFPVPVERGERILLIEVMVDPTTDLVGLIVRRDNGNGSSTGLVSVTTSGLERQKLSSPPLSELVGSSDVSYVASVSYGSIAGVQIGPLFVTTDVPVSGA